MNRSRKQQELEKKLVLEEYDPVTLKDRAEDEHLLIEEEKNESEQEREQAVQIVKEVYKKIIDGHAVIRTQLSIIVIINELVFGLVLPVFFTVLFFVQKWYIDSAQIFGFLFLLGGCFGGAFIGYWFFLRTVKKLFDVYYFQQGKKRIIIYQNYKHTIYYRNRKELICIENKSKRWVEDYGRDDFMNLKLGFNSLVGDLQYQNLKRGGYIVWSPERYNTATNLYRFSGYASLRVDENNNPVRLFVDGGRNTSYIYDFKKNKDFKVKIPRKMLYVCEKINIEPPRENQWLSFE